MQSLQDDAEQVSELRGLYNNSVPSRHSSNPRTAKKDRVATSSKSVFDLFIHGTFSLLNLEY